MNSHGMKFCMDQSGKGSKNTECIRNRTRHQNAECHYERFFFFAFSNFATKLHERIQSTKQKLTTMDTYLGATGTTVTMKPPTLSLKKRSCPLVTTVCKHTSKEAVPCSLSTASRPITPDLFIPILSTIDQPVDSSRKEKEILGVSRLSENFQSLESNQTHPSSLIPYNKVCDGDSSSRTTTTKKKQRTSKFPSVNLSPSNSRMTASVPKPKIKPKKHRVTAQSIVILDAADRTCSIECTKGGKKNFQTANSIPVAIPLTPMLSRPSIHTTIDPVSAIRRQLSHSIAIGDNLSQCELVGDEPRTLGEKIATPTRVSLSKSLIIPSFDELLDDSTKPAPIDQPPLLPQLRMRRSIKRCLQF